MKFNNKVLTFGLVVAFLQMPATSFAQGSGANRQNPLLQKSSLPFGAPDFSKIQETDYLPAIEVASRNSVTIFRRLLITKRSLPFKTPSLLLKRVASCSTAL